MQSINYIKIRRVRRKFDNAKASKNNCYQYVLNKKKVLMGIYCSYYFKKL